MLIKYLIDRSEKIEERENKKIRNEVEIFFFFVK